MTTDQTPDLPAHDAGSQGVEEIIVGLPDARETSGPSSECCTVSRSLLSALHELERHLLDIDHVDPLVQDLIEGLAQRLDARKVTILLHDPVGEIERHIKQSNTLAMGLQLTPDSFAITRMFDDSPSYRWLPGARARDAFGLSFLGDEAQHVLAVPLLEFDVVVGAMLCADPNVVSKGYSDDLLLLRNFGLSIPILLRRVMVQQANLALIVLDPVAQCANRVGLERELERELERARRKDSAVSVVTIALKGLAGMSNLSQRHLQNKVLADIAGRITDSLRATDTMARIGTYSFAVLMVDAPVHVVPDVALRFETDLRGRILDDGRGGMVEIDPIVGYLTLDATSLAIEQVPTAVRSAIDSLVQASEHYHRGAIGWALV